RTPHRGGRSWSAPRGRRSGRTACEDRPSSPQAKRPPRRSRRPPLLSPRPRPSANANGPLLLQVIRDVHRVPLLDAARDPVHVTVLDPDDPRAETGVVAQRDTINALDRHRRVVRVLDRHRDEERLLRVADGPDGLLEVVGDARLLEDVVLELG